LAPHSWDGVGLPLLVITGTNDLGARGEGLTWRREPFDRARSRLKHLAVVRGGDHQLGGIPPPGTRAGAGARTEVRRAVAAVTVAFADRAHGDRQAGEWLSHGPHPSIFEHAHREDTVCPTT